MSDQQLKFAEGFPIPTYEEWVAEVEKALKGAPFDKRMYTKTYEGMTLRPVYTRQDWPSTGDPSGFPAAMPFTRGGRAAGNRVEDWDVRQIYAYPDPAECNGIILNELARGVTSLHLRFDRAARAGLDADQSGAGALAGVDGTMIYSVDDLDRLLTGVYLDLVTISLDAGAQAIPAAAMLEALWHRRRLDRNAAKGAFNVDPLAILAQEGQLPTSIEQALAQLGEFAEHTAADYPHVTAVGVNTSPYHDAGATESQDLAVSMATAVAYLEAMTTAGLDFDRACRQILFTYSVPCDQFLGICKLRAARKMWARVAEACGATEPSRAMRLNAVTAWRMMSKRDPWVNMLRTTVACFAAVAGGADSITVQPFDAAIGLSDELGRRIARNTQVILAEESNLAKVVDPAGGSWYVESRTDKLAEVAWAEFQAIEKAGGIVQVLKDGSLAENIADAYRQREANLAKRRDPLTGISEFPNILEAPLEHATPDRLAAIRASRRTPEDDAVEGHRGRGAGRRRRRGGSTRRTDERRVRRGAGRRHHRPDVGGARRRDHHGHAAAEASVRRALRGFARRVGRLRSKDRRATEDLSRQPRHHPPAHRARHLLEELLRGCGHPGDHQCRLPGRRELRRGLRGKWCQDRHSLFRGSHLRTVGAGSGAGTEVGRLRVPVPRRQPRRQAAGLHVGRCR